MSELWNYVNERLEIKRNLSTAYHFLRDGDTKKINKVMEQYFRAMPTISRITRKSGYRWMRISGNLSQ